VRRLAKLYAAFNEPRLIYTIKSCAQGQHGACGHTRSARFLHALGSEYAQFSIEHDPELATLRSRALRYGEDGLRREFLRWLRALFEPRQSAHWWITSWNRSDPRRQQAIAKASIKAPAWRRQAAGERAAYKRREERLDAA
jgi:hypothetical protein